MAKYQNKYRIESSRRPGWDYRTLGAYFMTICTKNRQHFFGRCIDGQMRLSPAGDMAFQFWQEIPQHFEHVQLGEFVVMPNHVHGILILLKMGQCENDTPAVVETLNFNVSTQSDFFRQITPKSGSVSRIIQQYKRVCTINIRKSHPDLNFGWQERFHDHIIRDEPSFQRISNYSPPSQDL